MTSRLSSLLVRDGLVRVHRMEHVFQRQVIYGGTLDTILLEMGLVESHRIEQYLSLATGLPPASTSYENMEDSEELERLVKVCPADMATAHAVVPVLLTDSGIEVLVCDPVDVDKLEKLADALDRKVTPMVVPEYVFRSVRSRIYKQELDERFGKLAARAKAQARIAEPTPPPPVDSVAKQVLEADGSNGVPTAIEPESTKPADTSERVRGKRPPEEKPARRQTMEMTTTALKEHQEAVEELAQQAPRVEADAASETMESEATPSNADASESIETSAVSEDSTEEAAAPEDHAHTSITPEMARSLLAASEDRDEIFTIFMRAIRRRALYVTLFTIKGNTATGRLSLSKKHGYDDASPREVSVPLDVPSRFRDVMEKKAFSIGALKADDESVLSAYRAVADGEVPASAFLLPVVMRDRVIAIALAHNAEHGINVGWVTELLPLATATADAMSRIIAQMRAAQSANSAGAKTPETANKSDVPKAAESSSTLPLPNPEMVTLFERLEGDHREAAMTEALERVDEVVAHLQYTFPGKRETPRTENGDRIAAAKHGPILDLVTRLGSVCGPALSEKMRDADREVRYYATLCAAEIRPDSVLNELVERLFDGDECIRDLAVEALREYPRENVSEALDFARRALHSEDNARLRFAAEGLARLGDVSAIPDLIDAHSRGGDAAEASRQALFQLTNQSFGNSTRKWRTWWDENQNKHRIEWMLAGLASKNAEARKHAVETLRSLTGQFFGYGHDLTKKERDKTRKLWEEWWAENAESFR